MENTPDPFTTYDDYGMYYRRVIDQVTAQQNRSGLKLVVGPTGLGKTSAIPQVIAQYRSQDEILRFVYTSHRHMLIGEMEKKLKEKNIPCVYLKNDENIVVDFLHLHGIADFLKRLDQFRFFEYTPVQKHIIEQHIVSLRQDHELLQGVRKHRDSFLYKQPKEAFERRCSEFLNVFKTGLSNPQLPENTREQILKDAWIWKLFPYIAYLKDPDHPVLLVTIHKLLYGFFNGKNNERILSLNGNIIFLDEFDMQEKELLKFLCSSPEVQNSFEFVRLFYEEMSRLKKQGDLEILSDDSDPKIKAKQAATFIVDTLEQNCQKEGFNFPQLRHFILRPDEFEQKKISIFQSSVQITPRPFYLIERDTGWEIIGRSKDGTLRGQNLINLISRTTDAILNFFSDVWADGLQAEWKNWIEKCYDQKNDNSPGRYQKIISEYGLNRRSSRIAVGAHDGDLSDSIYFQGYGLFRLLRRDDYTAPDEVRVEQKKLSITPEYILWRLCESNLVFALSATGDIRRYVNSFDITWLEKFGHYIPVDSQDKELIVALKQKKAMTRKYGVRFEVAQPLQVDHVLNKTIANLEAEQFFQKFGEEPSSIAIFYRKQALSLFFSTLHWVTQKSKNRAHLVFMNSFAFIENFLKVGQNGVPESLYKGISQYIQIQNVDDNQSRSYFITFEGKECQVVFLDASKGKEMEDVPFSQLKENVPVIVVTTYQTASNGVNLKWQEFSKEQKTGRECDFEGIHLLEAPHYYFSGNEADTDEVDKDKVFIWQVWKLYANLQISEKQFHIALQEMDSTITNELYKKSPDYLLNQISIFYQALGRVDRQWMPMPEMEIRLATGKPGVYELFVNYLQAQGEIAKNRLYREAYTSSLILELHEQIKKQNHRMKVLNSLRYEEINHVEQQAKTVIDRLLDMLAAVRNGEYATEDSRKAMRLWRQVREAALKQDYHYENDVELFNQKLNRSERFIVNFPKSFTFQTAHLQPNDALLIDWTEKTIHPSQTELTSTYNLNAYYRNYAQNRIVNRYFRYRNYKLAYQKTSPTIVFTPYVLQTVLAGAIGEEVVKAILQDVGLPLLSESDYSPALFEIYDLEIIGYPIYIDAKNYSNWTTLYRFSANREDPEYDEKMNSAAFLAAAQRKWEYISNHTGDKRTKLVFINLLAGDNHPNEGWDETLKPVVPFSFSKSAICIIQGVFQRENPELVRDDFMAWAQDTKQLLRS